MEGILMYLLGGDYGKIIKILAMELVMELVISLEFMKVLVVFQKESLKNLLMEWLFLMVSIINTNNSMNIFYLEPGYYKENCYGIRIENCLMVVNDENDSNF